MVHGGPLENVELSVDRKARAEFGHETHPLEVTTTLFGGHGGNREVRAFRTKVAVVGSS